MKNKTVSKQKNPNYGKPLSTLTNPIELFGFISDTLDLMIISDCIIEKSKYSAEIENALLQYFGIE